MKGTVIVLIVIVTLYYLGKFAISEGNRLEQQKKFLKDLEEFDKKHKPKIK